MSKNQNPYANDPGFYGADGHEPEADPFSTSLQAIQSRFDPTHVRDLHQASDVDSSQQAQHHTLGYRHNQASPGDHTHDGVSSKDITTAYASKLVTPMSAGMASALGVWNDYTPLSTSVWGSNGAIPAINNGFLKAGYCKIGKLVHYQLTMVFGSTTNFGTGGYLFYLPFTCNWQNGGATWAIAPVGSAAAFKAGTAFYNGAFTLIDPNFGMCYSDGAGSAWGQTVPVTWLSGNSMSLSITYESTT